MAITDPLLAGAVPGDALSDYTPDVASIADLRRVGELGLLQTAVDLIRQAQAHDVTDECVLEIMKGCLKTCCEVGGADAAYLFGYLAENYFLRDDIMKEVLAASMDVRCSWGAIAGQNGDGPRLPAEHPIRLLLEDILPVYGCDNQIEMMSYVARLAREKGQIDMLDYVSELAWYVRDQLDDVAQNTIWD